MSNLDVRPEEFGLQKKQVEEIISNLPTIKKEREPLEAQYQEALKLNLDDASSAKIARELRLKIRDNRTKGILVWHKNAKDYFLKGGQFVDAIKRKEVAVNEAMESRLQEIEDYQARKEAERKESLRVERSKMLEPYAEFAPYGLNLGEMSEDDFQKTLNGAKLQFDAEEKRKQEEEDLRIENERLESELVKRQREIAPYAFFAETTVSKGMSEEDYQTILKNAIEAKKADDEMKEAQRIENERLKKEAEDKEKALELERKKAREEANRLEKQRLDEIEKERAARVKLESELKAKREAEEKAQRERLAAELAAKKEAERLAKAPIKKQLQNWVDSFDIADAPVANDTSNLIQSKFESFKVWAKNEIEKL